MENHAITSNATGSEPNHRPRIGLALGSGSARELAHLGVIRAIEDAGINIDFIADTSMGRSPARSMPPASWMCWPPYEGAIKVLQKQASTHMISLNSVFLEVQRYARANKLTTLPIEGTTIHKLRNNQRGPLVSETMFDPMPPSPQRYIAACENTFQTGFFQALKRMMHSTGTGAPYIQQVLDVPLQDAIALHEELQR